MIIVIGAAMLVLLSYTAGFMVGLWRAHEVWSKVVEDTSFDAWCEFLKDRSEQ